MDRTHPGVWSSVQDLFSKPKAKYKSKKKDVNIVAGVHDTTNGFIVGHTEGVSSAAGLQKLRTLQRYHGGPNEERMAYMEARSPLAGKKMAVSVEQVSMFLTSGNYFFQPSPLY